jgi:VWFA-related protein
VQVSVWDGSSWGSWENVGTPVTNTSGGWSLKHLELTAYSGEIVRIGFYHATNWTGTSTGWYIDDLHFTGDDDNDGVGNYSDLCPGTPEGESVDASGCSACQNNPTGTGCPAADDDGDGVINEFDECPDTPAGADVNADGCSEQFKVQILDIDTTACPTMRARLIVTDLDGNAMSNLTEANFEVYEGDTLQTPITVQYEDQTTYHVAASLALDYSGSMGAAAITDMENAAVEFINQLTAEDVGEIIKFANGIETAQSFTSNKADLIAAVNAPTGLNTSRTKFYDSVYQAITDTSLQGGRKAVIGMTDGQDNASVHSAADVISHAQSGGVPVFTIGLGKSVNAGILRSIAEQTGGLYYETPDSSDLASIYQSISTVLKNQYVITFDSSYRDGFSHQLTIVATAGNLYGSDQDTVTVCLDSDNDGLRDDIEDLSCTNVFDADTDDDGIIDGIEDKDHDGIWDAGETNPCHNDSDNDHIPDGIEDSNHNGVVDSGETDPLVLDPNTDQDYVPDGTDNCPTISNDNQSDIDNDTVGDVCDNCLLDANPDQADADTPEDGIGNVCDDGDADGDGFSDMEETQCGSDPADMHSRCGSSFFPWFLLLLLSD